MANEQRGEVDIEIANKTYSMRPSFEAMCEIEAKTGKSIAQLSHHILNMQATAVEFLVIILAGTRAANHKSMPDKEGIGQTIIEFGITSGEIMNPCLNLLKSFLAGCRKGKGEANTSGE